MGEVELSLEGGNVLDIFSNNRVNIFRRSMNRSIVNLVIIFNFETELVNSFLRISFISC